MLYLALKLPSPFLKSGIDLCSDQQVAQEQVLEILPMVSEVNAISEELNKHRTFEVVLISAAAQESSYEGPAKTTKYVFSDCLVGKATEYVFSMCLLAKLPAKAGKYVLSAFISLSSIHQCIY